jgi:hypothetical protein
MLTTVLRFEAIVHNTKELGVGRALERFCEIINRLAGMAERFCTALDCVDVGFLTDQTLDQLPRSSQLGRTRVGGIDLNEPRIRAALATVLALAAAPRGFTVAELTAKVQHMTGLTQTGYTIRQAAYDLRKLRGKHLITKPGRSRRYQIPPAAARTIAALLALRNQVIGPILAGVRSPDGAASPPTGPPSTATTRPCASACRPSSPTSKCCPCRGATGGDAVSIRVPQGPRHGRLRCALMLRVRSC